MKILIFGANGMAGHMMGLYLMEKGYHITGFAKRQNHFFPCYIGDARDQRQVSEALAKEKYDVVINCIGILNQAVDANLADGIYLNSVLPHYIRNELQGTATRIIHISTDCVFSGDKGSYMEDDLSDAVSLYGRSKALGELSGSEHITFRTSIVGPELKTNGTGLFHWFMGQAYEVRGFTNVIWSGVTTLELAKAVEASFKQKFNGVYHLVNNQVISKYELLCLFNRYFKKNKINIKKDDALVSDKSLVNSRTDFDYQVPSYQQMLHELETWMLCHKELYRQYCQ